MHQINKNPTIEDCFLYYCLQKMKLPHSDFDLLRYNSKRDLLNYANTTFHSFNMNFDFKNTEAVFAELCKLQYAEFIKYSKELPNMFWVLKFDHFKDLLSSSPKLNYDVLECADTIVNIIVPNLLAIKTVTAQDILDYIQLNETPFQASPALAQDTSDFLTKFYLVP